MTDETSSQTPEEPENNSGDASSSETPFDSTDPKERRGLVKEVRAMIGDKYGTDFERRCGACAVYMLSALRQIGITNYRIVAGGVDALVASAKGHAAGTRWKGIYTNTGQSNYHVWLENDSGEKIDCSELPTEYNATHLWEPYEMILGLVYKEIPATTQAVLEDINRKYQL